MRFVPQMLTPECRAFADFADWVRLTGRLAAFSRLLYCLNSLLHDALHMLSCACSLEMEDMSAM